MAKQESQTRVYKVTAPGRPVRLVKATSQAAAVRHAASDFKAEIPTVEESVELGQQGVKIEIAGETTEPTGGDDANH